MDGQEVAGGTLDTAGQTWYTGHTDHHKGV